MYRMQCVKVGSLLSGEIDCVELEASLLAHKDKPAIINLNIGISYLLINLYFFFDKIINFGNYIFTCTKQVKMVTFVVGTTLKGGIDDLDLVIQTLNKCGFTRDQFYIHCDGALFGMMLPFIKQVGYSSLHKYYFQRITIKSDPIQHILMANTSFKMNIFFIV